MSNELVRNDPDILSPEVALEVLAGDIEKLSPQRKVEYVISLCRSLGLNPASQPFDFIRLNGKLKLYAKKDCTEQLRKINGVSLSIKSKQIIDDIYVIEVSAQDKTGRIDEGTGCVAISGLKGDAKANAMMKCETKAKRRVTLSICGLGILDETELDTIQNVSYEPMQIKKPTPIDMEKDFHTSSTITIDKDSSPPSLSPMFDLPTSPPASDTELEKESLAAMIQDLKKIFATKPELKQMASEWSIKNTTYTIAALRKFAEKGEKDSVENMKKLYSIIVDAYNKAGGQL